MLSVPRPDPDVLTSSMPTGEMILLHMRTGQYLGLNETGAFLWKLMERAVTPAVLSEALFQRFDVTRQRADEAVRQLMRELNENKLIETSDTDPNA